MIHDMLSDLSKKQQNQKMDPSSIGITFRTGKTMHAVPTFSPSSLKTLILPLTHNHNHKRNIHHEIHKSQRMGSNYKEGFNRKHGEHPK